MTPDSNSVHFFIGKGSGIISASINKILQERLIKKFFQKIKN